MCPVISVNVCPVISDVGVSSEWVCSVISVGVSSDQCGVFILLLDSRVSLFVCAVVCVLLCWRPV